MNVHMFYNIMYTIYMGISKSSQTVTNDTVIAYVRGPVIVYIFHEHV